MYPCLKGFSALVTGGTRGIGRAIACELRSGGALVTVTGRAKDGSPPEGCHYQSIDFDSPDAVQAFLDRVRLLSVDILVNNAGINRIGPFGEIKLDDFDDIQNINLRMPFLLCQAVLPYMRQKRWGRIVNIASVFGVVSRENRASYSASKFALDGLTAALAAEVASQGILANCVSPGFIDTELTRSILGDKGVQEVENEIPMKRLGKPEEVAKLVAWLASPENTYISGQNIVIDGGFTRV